MQPEPGAEQLKQQVATARRAVATLAEVLREPETTITRDAAIHRFEYSFETLWKVARAYFAQMENLELASPAAVIRSSQSVGLLTKEQGRAALAMAKDRSLTSSAYNEELATLIYARLAQYVALMDDWLTSLEESVASA